MITGLQAFYAIPSELTQLQMAEAELRAVAAIPANLTGDNLLSAIWHERRVELGLEGHRFFDLVRQGRAAQLLDGFVPGKSELFPIPTAEITLSNGQLTQNPGY